MRKCIRSDTITAFANPLDAALINTLCKTRITKHNSYLKSIFKFNCLVYMPLDIFSVGDSHSQEIY